MFNIEIKKIGDNFIITIKTDKQKKSGLKSFECIHIIASLYKNYMLIFKISTKINFLVDTQTIYRIKFVKKFLHS